MQGAACRRQRGESPTWPDRTLDQTGPPGVGTALSGGGTGDRELAELLLQPLSN